MKMINEKNWNEVKFLLHPYSEIFTDTNNLPDFVKDFCEVKHIKIYDVKETSFPRFKCN